MTTPPTPPLARREAVATGSDLRRMPVQCKHGRVSDWGDFGQSGAEPEPCYYCRKVDARDEIRDLVYRGIVRRARANEGLKAILEPLGLFRFMDLVDAITESIADAYEQEVSLAEVHKIAEAS